MASYLLDTNVVLRLIDSQDVKHAVCRAAVDALINQQAEICLAPQVLVEFWVVATRPANTASNGFGWTPDITSDHITRLCKIFRLHPESPDLFDQWRQLVKSVSVCGKRAHDARIAAFMLLHDIESVLTLNPTDFNGFGVNVVQPDMLANTAT